MNPKHLSITEPHVHALACKYFATFEPEDAADE